MIYCYLRVSTLLQDEQNQRQGIESFARARGWDITHYVIDKASGTVEPSERNLGRLLRVAKSGDTILISELSRLGRRLFMLFRILEKLMKKGVRVYSVKDGYTLDGSIQSTVMAFAFGLAAQVERDMISKRTKEALAYKRAQGVRLGRPVGAKTRHHKLDPYREKIVRWKARGWSNAKIARKTKVCEKTLRKYMNQN